MKFLAIFFLSLLCLSQVGRGESPNNGMQFKLGVLSATLAGQLPREVSGAPTWVVEYSRYYAKDLALFGGFRKAEDSEAERTLYQGVSLGLRYYPLSLGAPIADKIHHNVINYDFSWKTSVEAGVSMGRYLLVTLDNPAIFEVSSDVFGLFFGVGGHWQVLSNLALDFGFQYEQLIGMSDHIEFSGSHTILQMGTLYYF